ncbi:MAG: hypothetical protein A3K10_15295 [Bacteroidetes bacterium RIFCSPLOWO2_12_FULL_31_6]|nr:MAG: hypothetical protein A3K10_15295 [Bacteroidetes bacterium RIFCSPLOWO2_12_FULL_31_6]
MKTTTYTLKNLLHFWQRQMDFGFPVIEAIVNLMVYPHIKYKEKPEIIVDLLRKHGLYEVGYNEDRIFIIENKQVPFLEVEFLNPYDFSERRFEVVIEFFNIKILNANIQFSMILN